jgi:hypothetical protein
MSTILNIRKLKLAGVSRTALVVGTVVVLGIVGGLIGWNVQEADHEHRGGVLPRHVGSAL